MTWAQLPLVRLALPFLTGILAAFFISVKIPSAPLLCFLIFLIALQVSWTYILKGTNTFRISSGITFLLPLTAGFLLMSASKKADQPEALVTKGIHAVKVMSVPVEKGKFKKFRAGFTGNESRFADVMLYVPKEINVNRNDELIVYIRNEPVNKIPNPHEFDYPSYLRKQNIAGVVFVSDTGHVIIAAKAKGILTRIDRWRSFLLNRIRDSGLNENSCSLMMSLVLGSTDDLSDEIMKDFSASGTMHVLSVSGMHIALLYALFLKLFSLLPMNRKLKYISIFILIWLYSGLTGFSPSVLRAAVICSFMIAGEMSSKIGHSLNLLAASLILLLSVDPFLVFNPGFQLSYTAVAGILLFQRKLNDLLPKMNRVGEEVKNAATVTLAAQIGTIGVSLFYFGQFPVYFLFANLIIVPISSILLYVGLGYLVLILFIESPWFLNNVVNVLFELFNVTVRYFGSLPYAVAELKIDLVIMILIYALLAFIYMTDAENKWKMFRNIVLMCSLLSGYLLVREFQKPANKIWIPDGNSYMAGLEHQGQVIHLKKDSLVNNSGIFFSRNIYFCFGNVVVAAPDSSIPRIHSDLLVVSGKTKIRNSDLMLSSFDTLVITRGVSRRRAEFLEEQCIKSGRGFWNVTKKGALIKVL